MYIKNQKTVKVVKCLTKMADYVLQYKMYFIKTQKQQCRYSVEMADYDKVFSNSIFEIAD